MAQEPQGYGEVLELLGHLCEREGLGPLDPIRSRAYANLGFLIASRETPASAWRRLQVFVEEEITPPLQ